MKNNTMIQKNNKDAGTPLSVRKRRQRLKNDISAWIWLLPVGIVLYLMIWRPTVLAGVWSFFRMKGYTPVEFIGLRNYYEVLKDTQFLATLYNTIKYVVFSLLIGFIPPFVLAVMVNEMVHFKNGFKTLIYLPAIVPGIAVYLMWSFIYFPDATGLLNMVLSALNIPPYGWLSDERFTIFFIVISMTWGGCGATVLLYYSSLQSLSADLYEAATIDGAGIIKKAWHITIPQMGGILLLQLVSQIIGVFQVVEQPMTMTGGGPNNASISLGFQIYKYGFVNGRAGHAMALSVLSFGILLIITCFYFYLQRKVEDNY